MRRVNMKRSTAGTKKNPPETVARAYHKPGVVTPRICCYLTNLTYTVDSL